MLVLGIDEVGRGCFAGPVVAGAVILPVGYVNEGIKDSKKLSERRREIMSAEIYKDAVAVGIGVVCNYLIDKIGIVPATKEAMQLALNRIVVPYDRIVVDAVKLDNIATNMINPIRADDKYISVAAASIVAKVYRDNLMRYLHTLHPEYSFDSNKGYGTKAHREALLANGYTAVHRTTFISSYIKG